MNKLILISLAMLLSSCSVETLKKIDGLDTASHPCTKSVQLVYNHLWHFEDENCHKVWNSIPKKMVELEASGITILARDITDTCCQLYIQFEQY